MRRIKRKRLVVSLIGAALGIAISAGIAAAVWTVSGTGSGSGAATVAQGLTATAVTPSGSAASLYPGGPAGPIQFTVNNPNPFAVTITGITYGTPVSQSTSQCASSNISLDANAPTTTSISIPAGGTSPVQTLNGVLDLAHSAPNGCQGVGFNVGLTLTATQQ